jgi:hypothetical protein
MTQHFDHWCGDVRGPHGDTAIVVTQAQDSVVRVLLHDSAGSQLGLVLGYNGTMTRVLVP